MANNFRFPGDYYLSKSGTDANGGTSPQAPVASVARIVALRPPQNTNVVVGTGSYAWNTDASENDSMQFHWKSDGIVKMRGNGTSRQRLSSATSNFTGFMFEQFAGFDFRSYIYSNTVFYRQCIFKVLAQFGGMPNSSGSTGVYEDCLFFNVNRNQLDSDSVYRRCLFFNCQLASAAQVEYCYLDATSGIACTAANNNNVDPGCDPAQSQGLKIGSAGWGLTNTNGISAPPLFNSLAKEDFSLRNNSPHITKAIGPRQYRYANSYYLEFTGAANDAATQANSRLRATGTNAVVPLAAITDGTQGFEVNSQGGLTLQAMPTSTGFGMFTTGRVAFADIADEMTVMLLKAGLNFDTDYPVQENLFDFNQPEIYNNNVPDWSNYGPGNAGRNPNRLTYRMRWSIKSNPNADLANVSDWITGLTFVEFEWNQKPLWNPVTGLGNGDPGFDPAQGQAIQCTFYQLQVCLRNNYYH